MKNRLVGRGMGQGHPEKEAGRKWHAVVLWPTVLSKHHSTEPVPGPTQGQPHTGTRMVSARSWPSRSSSAADFSPRSSAIALQCHKSIVRDWDTGRPLKTAFTRQYAVMDCILTGLQGSNSPPAVVPGAHPGSLVRPTPFFKFSESNSSGHLDPAPGLDLDKTWQFLHLWLRADSCLVSVSASSLWLDMVE